jgi:hypothetical protein
MPELKHLSPKAIPAALEKAERYRLLNEPAEAESICLDILEADPENKQALITLLLAETDLFSKSYGVSHTQAKQILTRNRVDYEHAYYTGILAERPDKTQLARGAPGCGHHAYDGFREAMDWFEKAEAVRPAGIDDAVLRWKTCARMIDKNHLTARDDERIELPLE